MKRAKRALIVGMVFMGLQAGCGDGQEEGRRLTLTGSSTMAPLMAEIGRRYEALHTGVRIDVQTGGSTRGVVDARSGVADIGMASRALKPSESDLHSFLVARDGIAVILHRDNPVEHLTDEQIAKIYRGQTRSWAEVGGRETPITVVNKAEGRSTLELFLHHFGLKNEEVQAHVVIGDNQQGIKMVAGNPDAVGYVSIGTAETEVARGVPIKLLPMGGVAASVANVKAERFPLARELNLVTRRPPEGLVKEFIDFARSPEVSDLVEGLSFVPLAK